MVTLPPVLYRLFLKKAETMPSRPKKFKRSQAATEIHIVERRETATNRGYSWRWRKFSKLYLEKHPLCVMCEVEGRIKVAEVTDHITPHRGDPRLMWDEGNLQALCKMHHDSHKQAFEKSGKIIRTIGLDGLPIA
jgi:5-methylcytosine-specific restriction protein A